MVIMDDVVDFLLWNQEVGYLFWANGRNWNANEDFLIFMYEDDASPAEVFELVMKAYGH